MCQISKDMRILSAFLILSHVSSGLLKRDMQQNILTVQTLNYVFNRYSFQAANSVETCRNYSIDTCNYYQQFKTLTMYPTGTVSGSQLSRTVQNYQRI